jgi:hypothetical protein
LKLVEQPGEQTELDAEIKTVLMMGMKFEISNSEFEYLTKLDEDQRFAALCSLRYEHHILRGQTKSGKRKRCDTLTLVTSRNAIRFAVEFMKHGLKK